MGFNLTQIANDVLKVEVVGATKSDIIEYGVRWVVGQALSTGERVKRVNGELFVGAATNLVAAAGVGNQVVENSFDNIEMFRTETVIVDGNYMIKRKLYFHKIELKIEGGNTYEYHWMCNVKLAGYIRPQCFYDDNGDEIDYSYLAKFEGSEDANGVARSIPNAYPRTGSTLSTFRTLARKNDGDGTNIDSAWSVKDFTKESYHLDIPFWVEFATINTQSVCQGAVIMPYEETHVALTNEMGNIIVLTNAQAALFSLGQTIGIGTDRSNSSVASNRIVLSIQADTPVAGQSTITFDGEPANVVIGNVVASRAWFTGLTNGVRASTGSYIANDGKHPFVFRGYENPFGNVLEFIDGAKIVNHQLWVTTDRSAFNSAASVNGKYAAPYAPVAYVNSKNNGYVKELGYDKMFPFARLPIVSTGASSSTFYADYYYQDTGDRVIYGGGYWSRGSDAGLSCWLCVYGLSDSGFLIGFRLSFNPLKGVH